MLKFPPESTKIHSPKHTSPTDQINIASSPHFTAPAAPVRIWAIYLTSQDFIESYLQGRTRQSLLKVCLYCASKCELEVDWVFPEVGKETLPARKTLWPCGLLQTSFYSRFGGCFDITGSSDGQHQFNIQFSWGTKVRWFMTPLTLQLNSIQLRAIVFSSSPSRYQQVDRERKRKKNAVNHDILKVYYACSSMAYVPKGIQRPNQSCMWI